MINGGYKILDLKGVDHTLTVGHVHDGIYEAIEGTRKCFLISGLVVGGVEYHDIFATPVVEGSNYIFYLENIELSITIQDTDVVTIAEL